MSDVILEVKNLKKYFNTPRGMLHAVDGVSFSIERGKTLGVVGESGCGKSTLGRTLIHLLESTDGKIFFEGKDVTKLKKKELNEMIHFFTEKTDSAMVGKEFKYTPEQRRAYIEEGGAFHLDGYFTVFGEVLEGMDIVEAISRESYDVYNRPVKDVVIKRMVLLDE